MTSTTKKIPIGTIVPCKFIDNNYHKAEVLKIQTDSEGKQQYYVHYLNFNKRLDEWVKPNRFSTQEIELNSPKIKTPRRGRRSKRSTPLNSDGKVVVSRSKYEKDQEMKNQQLKELQKIRNIDEIKFGKYLIEPWYYSPYPSHLLESRKLYICEFCFQFANSERSFERHMVKCRCRHPPGIEIYKEGNLSIYEVDGEISKKYTRNLFLLSKLFLDHKSLSFNVELFLFYIVCENDKLGSHITGYFSKEKNSQEYCNLACILVLPQYQRKGYGQLMISLSYELSKKEKKMGSPEKPFSDLGLVAYRNYWAMILINILYNRNKETISIQELSNISYITPTEVKSTLKWLDLIHIHENKILIHLNNSTVILKFMKKYEETKFINPNLLNWVSYDQQL
ncbi:histone acetyltransferase [Anaeramoeba flamelloides]|uniref:Histone acetyltransferase ESA1 n=1 Tax=Anaeramoeba flamelloides TaxID=1746091 RepID=A0AAV7ZRI7_9EUKA|nr:histone acetyltransferase [Anaeramoeba flamelloides]KAJ6232655.1 histone acetyltransferase [Anaeramoeba flamelloides]